MQPIYPIRAARADGRVILDGSGTRRIAALPATSICSGHVYHVVQAVSPAECAVLHLTFVEAGVAGKNWRLREAGLFPVGPEISAPSTASPRPPSSTGGAAEASASDGGPPRRFLSFDAPVPVGAVPPARHPLLPPGARIPNETRGQGWSVDTAIQWSPRLKAHLELIDRFFVALRNAMAVAKALNRALILPRIQCLCERAQSPWGILPSCVKDGASTPMPFVCPLEYLLDLEELEGMWHTKYLQLHPWTLRDADKHPSVAQEINQHATTIRWSTPPVGGSEADASAPTEGGDHAGASTVRIKPGLSDVGWRQAVAQAGVDSARLLHLESADGAVFGGFEAEAAATEFDRRIRAHVIPGARRFGGTWCCTTTHYQAGTILYKRPWRLPQGAAARDSRAAEAAAAEHKGRPRPCYWEDCLLPGKGARLDVDHP